MSAAVSSENDMRPLSNTHKTGEYSMGSPHREDLKQHES